MTSDNIHEVKHNIPLKRFEFNVGPLTAELTYELSASTILFTHTGVPPELEGHGIGSRLVKAGLEYARANNLKVKSTCWFVSGYMHRHLEYSDLLDE